MTIDDGEEFGYTPHVWDKLGTEISRLKAQVAAADELAKTFQSSAASDMKNIHGSHRAWDALRAYRAASKGHK